MLFALLLISSKTYAFRTDISGFAEDILGAAINDAYYNEDDRQNDHRNSYYVPPGLGDKLAPGIKTADGVAGLLIFDSFNKTYDRENDADDQKRYDRKQSINNLIACIDPLKRVCSFNFSTTMVDADNDHDKQCRKNNTDYRLQDQK